MTGQQPRPYYEDDSDERSICTRCTIVDAPASYTAEPPTGAQA